MVILQPATTDFPALGCPCCKGVLRKFQDRLDNTGRQVLMGICRECSAIVNVTDLLRHDDDHQRESSAEFYSVPDDLKQNCAQEVIWKHELLDVALAALPSEFDRKSFADIGAGMGLMAAAGATSFERSYAVELNRSGIEQLQGYFPRSDNLEVLDDVSELPGDLSFVVMWHVLEHLPDIDAFMAKLVLLLGSGGALYAQVPMFHPEYVFDTHYTFLSERSFDRMFEKFGLRKQAVWYDLRVDFLTVLATKE